MYINIKKENETSTKTVTLLLNIENILETSVTPKCEQKKKCANLFAKTESKILMMYKYIQQWGAHTQFLNV